MTNFKSYLIAAFGLAVLIGSVVFSASSASNAAPTTPPSLPPLNVKIVNTTAEPVPTKAQGTTTIAGTVQVGNAATNPVPTRNVDDPARQTFQRLIDLTIPDGQSQASADLPVPAGKILVVEYVSGRSRYSSSFGSSMIDGAIGTFRGVQTVFHHFPFTDNANAHISVAGQLLRAYADSFGGMQIIVERAGSQGSQDVRVTVTGYLVDLQ